MNLCTLDLSLHFFEMLHLIQIKQLNEPVRVKITEWNTGGLLTRIEVTFSSIPVAEEVNEYIGFESVLKFFLFLAGFTSFSSKD